MRHDHLVESMREGLINKSAPLTIEIFYSVENNRFTDVFGELIINPFDLITTNDLYLFRQDSRLNEFPHRDFANITIKIMEA